MEKRGETSYPGKSWKICQKNNAMEIENVLKKSWKCHGISLPLITNHTREVMIIPYL